MNCNLEFYRAFYYTALYLSMTKASKVLNLTQPAVSTSIRKLEEYLGCSLFVRVSNGIRLTDEGSKLFVHVSDAFEALEAADQEIRDLVKFQAGSLVIGASETPLYHYVLPQIVKFKQTYPKVHISVNGHTTPDLIQGLAEGVLDIAFILSASPLPKELNSRALLRFQDIFVTTPESAALLPPVSTLQDLSEFPMIALKKGTDFRHSIEDFFQKNGSTFRADYSVENTSMILPFVHSGLGIGIIPSVYAASEIAAGTLVKVSTEQDLPPRTLYIATNRKMPVSSIGRQFISEL